MRFESLLWTILTMFLIGVAGWNADSLVGGVSGGGEYHAADGGSTFPPPDRP